MLHLLVLAVIPAQRRLAGVDAALDAFGFAGLRRHFSTGNAQATGLELLIPLLGGGFLFRCPHQRHLLL